RLIESRDPVEEQYRVWQNLQSRVYTELRSMKDPCNRNLIMRLMEPLKKEAKSYFDKRSAALATYYGSRTKAGDGTRAFFTDAGQFLESYEQAAAAQQQLIATDRERLQNLPPDAEQARSALQRAIVMQEEHLAKIARNLEVRKADQASAAAHAARP